MPFGLTNSPSVFSALINKVLGDLFDISVISYLDDICVFSKTIEEHQEHVEEVLKRLESENLFCKLEKCDFFKQEVTFCGHVVNSVGVGLTNDKIQAMKVRPKMKCTKDVQKYLGTAVWFQKFIPNYAEITLPLSDLLRKNSTWVWDDRHEWSITKLISAITTAPVLRYFDSSLDTEVFTDASDYAIGGWISQRFEDGWHPVLYVSRKLQPNELNFHTQEKECLAMIYMCENTVITYEESDSIPTPITGL
jgi:hypothetical protein